MGYKGFQQVELTRPQRSMFDLSHEKRLSARMGRLTPVFFMEVLPNDTIRCNTELILKLAPMLAPIMHRVTAYVHYFFVPYRLLWKDWSTFITGGRLGDAVTVPPIPPRVGLGQTIDVLSQAFNEGNLLDYLGFPTAFEDANPLDYANSFLDIMVPYAYQRIWMDYYRDRNYVADDHNGVNWLEPLESGDWLYGGSAPELTQLLTIRNRCWEHDYFTSTQPNTQRGAEVLMPLQGSVNVQGITGNVVYNPGGGLAASGALTSTLGVEKIDSAGGTVGHEVDLDGDIVDSSVSINDLRVAVALQKWLERNQLAGSRYNETIMAHFGRRTSDARLQRAEYLGGGKAVVQIGEVLNTAYSMDADDVVVPPANMSGRGSVFANTNRFQYNAEEWGCVFGILSVMPTSGYMQGVPRWAFRRRGQLDYPWPTFAHLGEQVVNQCEIMPSQANFDFGGDFDGFGVFGYQSRYADWKQIMSSAHGQFRTTLDFWHLTRKFASPPNLNSAFVTFEDTLPDRVFSVTDEDHLWIYVYNNVKAKRSLPYYGTPSL